jgi:hypothetical protein
MLIYNWNNVHFQTYTPIPTDKVVLLAYYGMIYHANGSRTLIAEDDEIWHFECHFPKHSYEEVRSLIKR